MLLGGGETQGYWTGAAAQASRAGRKCGNSRTGQLLGLGANDRGGGVGAGVSSSGKGLALVRREGLSS